MVGIPSHGAAYHGGTVRGAVSSLPFGKDTVINAAPPQKTYVCVLVARPEGCSTRKSLHILMQAQRILRR
jgi:hypothetical protein